MIKILDSFVADKIAAGEVIERPLSIVKELVENSIDAGASHIIVEMKKGGKQYLRVTDDGCGIPSDEVEIAFERHSTGKISTVEDLGHISTLGFRGEALASICAISRLTVFTKTHDEPAGTKMVMHGGKKVSFEQVGMNDGTTFVIEDVFYNTPARRKFMKSDAAEASVIIDLIQKMAIYYADIAFRLINNGQTVISTSGDGSRLNVIQTIYPSFKNLIEVSGEGISGYVSDPGTTRSSRRGQIFFVNGRIVRSRVIEKGIKDGYGDRIFSGFPIAVLFLEVDPEKIDVNIHPSKREVKFLDEKAVSKLVADAVRNAVFTEKGIPGTPDKVVRSVEKEQPVPDNGGSNSQDDTERTPHRLEGDQMDLKRFLSMREHDEGERPVSEVRETYHTDTHDNDEDDIIKNKLNHEQANTKSPDSGEPTDDSDVEKSIDIRRPSAIPFDFGSLVIMGYIFDTYIITQSGDSIYVLDQHAAHERILYERLISRYNSKKHVSQPLLLPFTIETSQEIYNADRSWLDQLSRLGYDIEDFGAGQFRVRGIPEYMDDGEARVFAESFIESMDEDGTVGKAVNTVVADKLIMRSCKAAVKGNDRLSDMEMKDLLKQLSECVNPFSCPHGRPTFVKITRSEIERAFRRQI
jgi:DNA mismatch repair protein MutL